MRELGIAKERVIYVGDSDVDIETADNADVRCISVSWGFRDKAFLVEHGADVITDHPLDILGYL